MNAMCMDMEVLKGYRETVYSNGETAETVETTGDTCKYKSVRRVRERLKRLQRPWKPATCKYKLVWRDRDWKRVKGLGRLWRLWRPKEIHECIVYGGNEGLERL